jgi:glycosyltransferase involved in cell wall biosynthesis
VVKYLFVTNSPSGGGAERATNILVSELQKMKVDAGILTVNSGVEDLITPSSNNFSLDRTWRSGPIETISTGFKYRKTLLELNPEVVIANCDLPEFLAAFFAPRCKVICVEHSRKPWRDRKTLGFIVRLALRIRGVKWISVSSFAKPWASFSSTHQQINNPVDFQSLGVGLENIAPKGRNIVERLLFVGRLDSEQKRPSWLIEIANNVGLPITFIGPEAGKTNLEEFAKSCAVSVSFVGHRANPWENWNAGDLLIVPSSHEADGLVPVEAIGLRIPLLISDLSEFRRFNLSDSSYCKDVADFSNRIDENRNDISFFQTGQSASEGLRSERDPRGVAQKWQRVLSEVSSLS